jgi:hypothetical protein
MFDIKYKVAQREKEQKWLIKARKWEKLEILLKDCSIQWQDQQTECTVCCLYIPIIYCMLGIFWGIRSSVFLTCTVGTHTKVITYCDWYVN